MGLRPLEFFIFFPCGDRLYTSESDVYRRQILTYKDGPRAVRVKLAEKNYWTYASDRCTITVHKLYNRNVHTQVNCRAHSFIEIRTDSDVSN